MMLRGGLPLCSHPVLLLASALRMTGTGRPADAMGALVGAGTLFVSLLVPEFLIEIHGHGRL